MVQNIDALLYTLDHLTYRATSKLCNEVIYDIYTSRRYTTLMVSCIHETILLKVPHTKCAIKLWMRSEFVHGMEPWWSLVYMRTLDLQCHKPNVKVVFEQIYTSRWYKTLMVSCIHETIQLTKPQTKRAMKLFMISTLVDRIQLWWSLVYMRPLDWQCHKPTLEWSYLWDLQQCMS